MISRISPYLLDFTRDVLPETQSETSGPKFRHISAFRTPIIVEFDFPSNAHLPQILFSLSLSDSGNRPQFWIVEFTEIIPLINKFAVWHLVARSRITAYLYAVIRNVNALLPVAAYCVKRFSRAVASSWFFLLLFLKLSVVHSSVRPQSGERNREPDASNTRCRRVRGETNWRPPPKVSHTKKKIVKISAFPILCSPAKLPGALFLFNFG